MNKNVLDKIVISRFNKLFSLLLLDVFQCNSDKAKDQDNPYEIAPHHDLLIFHA